MASPVTWIRNNMLFSPERKLTEAELKVQKSLQKLSIPEWYLNKRTSPPKIRNMTPIGYRPPAWRYSVLPTSVTLKSTSCIPSVTFPTGYQKPSPNLKNDATTLDNKKPSPKLKNDETKPDNQKPSPKFKNDVKTPETTKTMGEQKSEANQKKSPQKCSLSKDNVLNTKVPVARILLLNKSLTFPRMSPSKKIENINIVLPIEPKIEILERPKEPTEETKYKTYLVKKSADSAKKGNNDTKKEDETLKKDNNGVLSKSSIATPKKNYTQIPRKTEEIPKKMNQETPTKIHSRIAEMVTPLRTPDIKTNFKIRTTSTPKCSPVNLFSSTIIEDYPNAKKTLSPNILEKSSIFENSFKFDSTFDTTMDRSDSFMEKSVSTLRSENSSRASLSRISPCRNSSYENKEETKPRKSNWLFENNIRSIDPILFEKDESPRTLRSPSMVRKIVKKIESQNSVEDQSFKLFQEKKKNSEADRTYNNSIVQERKSKFEKNFAPLQVQRSNYTGLENVISQEKRSDHQKSQNHDLREKKFTSETQSPCTKFLNSRKKSTDLENVVKSKKTIREKSLVQEIIETLSAKINKSIVPRHNDNLVDPAGKQNFVKKLVDALEKSEMNKTKENVVKKYSIIEEDSSSESEDKSFLTSASPKDTESDSEPRSSNVIDNENQSFDCSDLTIHDEQTVEEDDSVYWIPVPRCKLPRSSSLLSIISRLSSESQSPCVSPISERKFDSSGQSASDSTLKRTSISRKLFRIDETIVFDSGYSDKSDKSAMSSEYSTTDYTWSELDTLNDFEADISSSTFNRSIGRKSFIGQTYSVPW
ncbi:uncharacterized protein LOC108632779 isoform X2 [Ceratina calcarata]|uniref:Uncharacterized protein LOC108632779 isoform X2 n=1 Tax=Ceratina calcarata TaxID=156304 RepID=A0AAJ7NGD4_9HYME|nr:uncharacterized protein LOC108632779 isoform X2 [Ceratina calcarata]